MIRDLTCPGCGAPLAAHQEKCTWCHRPIYIAHFSNIYEMGWEDLQKTARIFQSDLQGQAMGAHAQQKNMSLAMCWLRLGLYDKAAGAFEAATATHCDSPEAYFLYAICLLEGRNPFMRPRRDVDRAIHLSQAALELENQGIYWYFMAYLIYDHYIRKHLRHRLGWQDCLAQARQAGISRADIQDLHALLKTDCPPQLQIGG